MAQRVSNNDILKMNELYYADPVYSHVAKLTGFSPTTVKKYIIPGFRPRKPREKMNKELPAVESIVIPENLGEWLNLTFDEELEISDFKQFEVQI